ncbi:MAG: hypothetical protein HY727_01185 [Candidatus Rokubacteria bacterium]|nr:hypothetical protein [Candidatus Rokubacteria bacterium]
MAGGADVKVCFFNRSYWPDEGSTGQLLTELAEDLVRDRGCEVTVVAGLPLAGGRRPGWRAVECQWHDGVRILRARGTTFRPRRFAGRVANYLTYFASACLAALRVGRVDVVVALTDPPIIGLAALLSARRAGARFVFLCQDVFPEVAALLEDFRSARVDRVSRLLLRRAIGWWCWARRCACGWSRGRAPTPPRSPLSTTGPTVPRSSPGRS